MDLKVKFFLNLGFICTIPFLLSCQNTVHSKKTVSQTDVQFSGHSQSELDKQIEFAEDKLKAFQLECEWVDVRKKVLRAEMRASESTRSLLKLERELLKFQKLQNNFPHETGFISQRDEIEWKSRLKVKKAEVKKLNAVVRLLKRDMNALEAKLHRNGYGSVKNAIFIESQAE